MKHQRSSKNSASPHSPVARLPRNRTVWLRRAGVLVLVVALLVLAGCRDEPEPAVPEPEVHLLAPTATSLVARVEVVIVVVTPTPAPTATPMPAPVEEQPAEPPTEQPVEQPTAQETAATPTEAPAAPTPALSNQQLINMGEDIYASECASCHQLNGEGTSIYPALNQSGLLESGDPTQAIQIVLYGRGQMPAFEGALSNEQIAAVISYERNAWQNDASVVKPAQVRRVQEGESAIAEQPAETPATPTETVTTTGTVNATAGTPTAEAAAATATPMTPPAQTPVAATATATADMASPTVAATEPPTSTVVPGLLEGATPPSLASPALTWTPAREVTPLLPTASTAEDEGTTTPVPAETTPATAASSPQQTGTPTLDVTVSIRGDAGGDDPPLTWTPARQVTPLLPSVGAEEDEGTVTPAPTEETPAPTVAPSPRETDTPQAAETAAATPAPTDTATEVTATTPEEEAATATPQPTETPAETPDQALINLGEEIYATECASCHRLSGEGSSVYPALNESELLISQDPTEAIRIVLYGMGQMPAFADILSTEEIAAVLSYERNAWDNDASVVTVEQVEEVQEAPTPTDAAEEE